MFVDNNEMETDRLRQGDILRDIPFPLIDVHKVQVLSEFDREGFTEGASGPFLRPVRTEYRLGHFCHLGQIPFDLCFCTVVSQCCEVQPNPRGKLLAAAFSIARLIRVKEGILDDSAKLSSLRQNKDPRNPTSPGYIDHFYIQAHPLLQNREWMVDYAQLVSLPAYNFPAILAHKVLQMRDRERVKFKVKLATYLGRLTNEEHTRGLEDPWGTEKQPAIS